jgi:hypothetical protein
MNEVSAKRLIRIPALAFIPSKFGDAEIVLLYSLALFLIALAHRFIGNAAFDIVFEFNAGEVLALCAIYVTVKPRTADVVLSRMDLGVIAACSLLMLPPGSQHFAFLGASVAGLYFVLRRPNDPTLNQVGLLWLAIAGYESFGRLFFKLVSGPLMQLELVFIAKIGPFLGFHFFKDGIRLVSSSGWYVYMMDRCSSFHNISLAVLIWLSLLKIAGADIRRRQFVALGVATLSIIVLNAIRFMLMTISPGVYYFLHDGVGTLIFSCATFFAVAMPTAFSLRREA